MSEALDGTPINIKVQVRVTAEPRRGFIGRNLHLIVMLCLAMICALLAGSYWVLVALVSLECAAWADHQRIEERAPFFVRWGKPLYMLAIVGALAGILASVSHSVSDTPETSTFSVALLIHLVQSLGGYLLVDQLWHYCAHESEQERAKNSVALAWLFFVGVAMSLGTSIWIRYL